MAKQGGMGDNLYIAGYDLSGDILSLEDVGGGPAVKENTGINKSAVERIGLLRDGRMNITTAFNPGVEADAAHARFKLLPTTDVLHAYCRGTTLGNQAACMIAKQPNYDGSRGDDGDFTFKVQALANGFGLEWGRLLTAGKRTDATATNGASIDTTASAAFGAQAYLQVFAFTGTSVTVKIQDSADDAAWADVTGLTFTAATGITTERLATANNATIRRYLRAVTTGTFSNAVFSVVVVKNEIAGQVF
jgi:hypothetical protein